eukprot:gene26911-33089_t
MSENAEPPKMDMPPKTKDELAAYLEEHGYAVVKQVASSGEASWKTRGGWFHTDQNALLPGMQGRVCVQGLVTLTDVDSASGGLCVIPGSHK